MRRTASILCLLWLFAAPIISLASGVANNPQSPISPLQQGPDPTGNAGYPLSVVNATGTTLDVNVASGGGGLVTQGTTPWTVQGPDASGAAVSSNPFVMAGQDYVSSNVTRIMEAPAGYTINPLSSVKPSILSNSILYAAGVSSGFLNPVSEEESFTDPFNGSFWTALHCWSQEIVSVGGTGGVTSARTRTPAIFKTVATAAAGNTALWTPIAGKKFRLMRYMITVVDQATQAAPGTLTVSLIDGAAGATGQVHDIFVPAVGLLNTGSLYTSGWIDVGNGYLSTAANNVLNVNLSAALTAGTVRVICCGTEE